MSVAYVDTSVLTAIAFDEPGAALRARRLDEFTRLISSNLLAVLQVFAMTPERLPGLVLPAGDRLKSALEDFGWGSRRRRAQRRR